MRVNENYVLQEIADEYIVVPVGEEADKVRGIIKLNETGAFLWGVLSQGEATEEDLVRALMAEFAVEETVARADVSAFIRTLREMHCSLD